MTSSRPKSLWSPTIGRTEGRRDPLYARIAQAIETDIASGRLAAGEQLPTQRELATRMRTTVATITRAYSTARSRGLVSTEVGRGTFVRARITGRPAFDERTPDASRYDLMWSPPLPVPEIEVGALRTALRSLANDAALLQITRSDAVCGSDRQRAIAARWLSESGLADDPSRIVIAGGVQHAMNVVARALLAPGDVVLCEALTYPGLKALARDARLELVPIVMDDHGLVPDALDAACRKHHPRALYCVPTVHPVTTAVLSLERRRALIAIARRRNLLLIEDDDDTMLCSPRLPTLSELAPERVIHLADISKAIAPGLRIAFISSPPEFMPRLVDAVRSTIFVTSPIAAELVCRLLEDGMSRKVARARREEARWRQSRARALLPRLRGTAPLRANQAAHHVWYSLPVGTRADVISETCAAAGVVVAPGSLFAIDGRGPPALRISLSGEAERSRFEAGLRLLADVLSAALS